MKLNLDCVRDILFCVEAHTDLRHSCYFIDDEVAKKMAKVAKMVGIKIPEMKEYQTDMLSLYNNDELIYHVRYCIQAGLVMCEKPPDIGTEIYEVYDLSAKGHEFLANIRNKDNWAKAKAVGGKIGAFGLEMASKISEGIATAALNKFLESS